MKHAPVTRGPAVSSLEARHEALLVLDVDEVVLEFIAPFCALLEENGARLHFDSFRLTGNVRVAATGEAVGGGVLEGHTQRIYAEQDRRQGLVPGVTNALASLSRRADIVFLTAMTPRWHETRRAHLDRLGLPFPMIATERSKGAVMAELSGRWAGPVVFVDDLPQNLHGVRRSAPEVGLVHLMAHQGFARHLPPLPEGARAARDWPHAATLIGQMLSGGPLPVDNAGTALQRARRGG